MITIYDEFSEDFYNNGLGILKDCIDPIVKEELNGIFELQFDYPVNSNKREFLKNKNIIKCDCGYEQKQLFKIIRVKPNLENVTVYAQHITYDLATNILEDVYPQNLNGSNALDWILDRTQYPHKFKAFSDITKISTARYVRKNPIEAILGDEENSFVNKWGGELLRDNFTINMLQRRGSNTGYKIKVGKNVTGVEITEDDSNLCTRLMPIAYDGIVLPEKYVDSRYVNTYSHPYIKTLDCKDIKLKNSELEDAEGFETLEECYAEMRKRCVEKFEVEKVDRSKINIKVDFVDLKNTTEYEKYLHLETIKMGDTVTFIYKNISYELRVIKTEYDSNKKKFTKLELGEFKGNYITNSSKTITSIVKQETANIGDNLLNQAKENATEQIKTALGGYIYKTQNELFIMDTADVKTAKKIWRWNLNGLAYSEKGIVGPYKTAITQDGQIVANFITTGTMSADRIEGLSNTLNEFSKIIMDHNKIQLIVNNTVDITQEIEKETDILELQNCMEGTLLELRIDGDNNVFSETEFNENTKFNENTTFTGQSSILSIFSDNVCSHKKEDYEVGAYSYLDGTLSNFKCYIRNKDLFRLKKEYDQLKITVNQEYRLVNLYFYDKSRNFLGDNNHKFSPQNIVNNRYEVIVNIPEEAYYMGYIFKNKNVTSDQSEITIIPDEIDAINPQIRYFKKIDLGITEKLRCHKEIVEDTEGKKVINKICDQVVIKPGICTLIRRVGADDNGNTYKLADEIVEDLQPLNIYLLKGNNYIKLHNYSAKMHAKYIKTNDFTNLFTSQVEMNATLEMLYNQISLSVRQNNIMAALQMAIEDGQGVIEFKSDLFSLTSKFLKITREGKITATSGEFGGWILNNLYLYANYVINKTTYQCGLYSGVTNGNDVFLYAGAPLKSDGKFENVTKWNTYITKNGLINAKWFKVNGESGYFYITFDSGRTALRLNKYGIAWFLDNVTNNYFMDIELIYSNGAPSGMGIILNDALKVGIFDSLHPLSNGNLRDMITCYRLDPNSSNRQRITSLVESYSDIMVWGNREDSVNHSIFIQGYEVQTNASDMRLKKNIKPSEDGALDIINKIEIDSFDWKKPRYHKRKSVKFGYMAQLTQQILPSLVDYDKMNDKYQMNLLNLSALHTKGIQEISKENKLLRNILDFLVTELNCKEKLESYLKGDE